MNRDYLMAAALAGVLCACSGPTPTTSARANAAHGDPEYSESEVQVSQDGGEYVARKQVTISNDFGRAQQAELALKTHNGQIVTELGEPNAYAIAVALEARGSTEQEARDALESMEVTYEDTLDSAMHVATRVDFHDMGESSQSSIVGLLLGNSSSTPQRSASINAQLPAEPSYQMELSTSNGEVLSRGFGGASATLDTSNGGIDFAGAFGDVELTTSNGPIDAQLVIHADTIASLDTSNGPISVELAAHGRPDFELEASTSNGDASIDVAGTVPEGDQSDDYAYFRTPAGGQHDYSVTVSADSSNGDVDIHG